MLQCTFGSHRTVWRISVLPPFYYMGPKSLIPSIKLASYFLSLLTDPLMCFDLFPRWLARLIMFHELLSVTLLLKAAIHLPIYFWDYWFIWCLIICQKNDQQNFLPFYRLSLPCLISFNVQKLEAYWSILANKNLKIYSSKCNV